MKNLDNILKAKSTRVIDILVEMGSLIPIKSKDPSTKTSSVSNSKIFDKLARKYFPDEFFYLAYRI